MKMQLISDIYIISAKSQLDGEKSIEINIELSELTTFNTVSFAYTSARNMRCELLISEDGENYISVYDENSRDFIEWNFNEKTAKYLRIPTLPRAVP